MIKFDPSRTSVFAIDDIKFKTILCHEEAPKTTPAPLGIGSLFDLQPFPPTVPGYLLSTLNCNYEIETCDQWENIDEGFYSGFVPAKLPFSMPRSMRGNVAVAQFSEPELYAILQSPVISCSKNGKITVEYYSSLGSRLSICANNKCLKESTHNSAEISDDSFGHYGELSVNITSVKNFKINIIAESFVEENDASFAESFVLIKKIRTDGHFCRMKDKTELACESLYCDFRSKFKLE